MKTPARRDLSSSLTPDGPPPAVGAQWCPRCRNWTLREVLSSHPERRGTYPWGAAYVYKAYVIYKPKLKRCAACRSALVRPPKLVKAKKGELRPGVRPMW